MRIREILEGFEHDKDLDRYVKWLVDHLKQGGLIHRVMLDHPEEISMFLGDQAVLSPLIARHLRDKYHMEPEREHFTDDAIKQFSAAKAHSTIFRALDIPT